MRNNHLIFLCTTLFVWGCEQKDTRYVGYIETEFVYVAANISGLITQLHTDKGFHVHKNDILAVIDNYDQKLAVESAKNDVDINKLTLDQTNSELLMNSKDANRKRYLFSDKVIPESTYDISIYKEIESSDKQKIAQKNTNSAENKLLMERYNLSQTLISAPTDALIFDRFFSVGEFVSQGQPIFALSIPEHTKAIFFVPEYKLKTIKLNQIIHIYDEDDELSEGMIIYISDKMEYTPPNIYSSEYTHEMSFRVEAKIKNLDHIHSGQAIKVIIQP